MKQFSCVAIVSLLSTSMLALLVNVSLVSEWTGTVYIRADGSIDPPEARTVIETFDNVTYTLTGNIRSDEDGIIIERSDIIIDGKGFMVEGAGTYDSKGIRPVNSDNVTVKNVKVAKFTFGFYLFNSSNNNICENIITDNEFGIYLESTKYSNIYGNIIANNCWGLWFDYSSNNTLTKNEVLRNERHGITLIESSCNILQENDIMENGNTGIYLKTTLNNYILRNNLLKNGWCSIELNNANYTRIFENNIIESGYVSLSNSHSNEISRNNMIRNVHGILLTSSSRNSLLKNNIIESSSSGVWLKKSPSNCLIGNTFIGCGLTVYSCDLTSRDSYISGNNTVRDNLVNGKPLVYLENVSNFTVKDAGQVILIDCSNIRVENLTLSKASQGIFLWKTNNTIIANNIITENWICIDLCHSHNNTMIGNIISTNFGTNSANTEVGIILEQAHSNRIVKNNITKCSYGILLNLSRNNFIFWNNIENRIDFRASSNNNVVVGNNIVNANVSIYSPSSNNRIYHNNFMASDVYVCGSGNLWDNGYPSGGNYWRNYAGSDFYSGAYQNETGCDGIGDKQYIVFPPPNVIGPVCVDRYPLMAPFTAFDAGTWGNVSYTVEVVSNSTVSNFYFNPNEGAFLRFNVTGEDLTKGFCRVTIPKKILWAENGWIITINDQLITGYLKLEDESFTYIYFTYNHSTQTIKIQGTHVIPEFPQKLILPSLIILCTLSVVLAKKTRKVSFELGCLVHGLSAMLNWKPKNSLKMPIIFLSHQNFQVYSPSTHILQHQPNDASRFARTLFR